MASADFWLSIPTPVGDINKAVLEAFRGRGIVIPFPQREVRMLA